MTFIELVALDIAGTTVDEGGTVYRVLADTVRALGAHPAPEQIEQWMGASKREAIGALLTASGMPADDATVDAGFADFRARLTDAYRTNPPTPFPGVADLFSQLRSAGIKVALTTGFDRQVTDAVLESVGWDDRVVDAVVCSDDVSIGRPAPYLIFRAMERTGVIDVRRVLAAGDTVRDVESGRNAGAAIVLAVTSGEVPAKTLAAAGPTQVIDSVLGIPAVLAAGGQPLGALVEG